MCRDGKKIIIKERNARTVVLNLFFSLPWDCFSGLRPAVGPFSGFRTAVDPLSSLGTAKDPLSGLKTVVSQLPLNNARKRNQRMLRFFF